MFWILLWEENEAKDPVNLGAVLSLLRIWRETCMFLFQSWEKKSVIQEKFYRPESYFVIIFLKKESCCLLLCKASTLKLLGVAQYLSIDILELYIR